MEALRRLLLALFSCRSKGPKRTGSSSRPPRSQPSHQQPSARRAGEQHHRLRQLHLRQQQLLQQQQHQLRQQQHQLRQQQQQGAGASLFDAGFWNASQSSGGGLGETSSGHLNFASPQLRFAPLIRAVSDGESHPPPVLPALALAAHPFATIDNVPVDEICLSSDRTIFEKVPSEMHRPHHCSRSFCSFCAHACNLFAPLAASTC